LLKLKKKKEIDYRERKRNFFFFNIFFQSSKFE
jgi:hypothetical protein